MNEKTTSPLPAPQEVAIAYAGVQRHALAAFFALDVHCAGLVRRSSEPMLAQMRLTWWREALLLAPEQRPGGDRLLESLSAWAGEGEALAEAVGAWEHLVGGEPLDADAALAFASGRGQGFAGFARLAGRAGEAADAALAGMRWALADLASHVTDPRDRIAAIEAARSLGPPRLLSSRLRPLAVLDGLARRSLARGGASMLGDRGSALAAFRLGLLGR